MDIDLDSIYLDVDNRAHRFVAKPRIHPGGSIYLGTLTTVVGIKDALGNGVDAKFGLPGIVVKITAAREGSQPHPRIEFPNEEYSSGGRTGRSANYWSDNAATRLALTTLAFNLPEVHAAIGVVEQMIEKGQTECAPAATTSGLSAEAEARLASLLAR